jgi:hypothetical protein
MADAARDGAGRRQWLRVVAYVVAIAAWLLFSIPRRGTDGTAYWLGEIFGAALIALSIPLVIRLIYWQVKGRRPRFWTPLIFVLAAVLAVSFKVSVYANEEVQRQEKSSALVAKSPGSRSEGVKECITGALEADETRTEGPAHLGLTEPEFELLIVRYCREVERRDLFRSRMTRRQILRVMNDVAAAMVARGELPRRDELRLGSSSRP